MGLGVGEDGVMAFTDFGIENPDRTHQNPQRQSDAPGRLETPDYRSPRPTPDGY